MTTWHVRSTSCDYGRKWLSDGIGAVDSASLRKATGERCRRCRSHLRGSAAPERRSLVPAAMLHVNRTFQSERGDNPPDHSTSRKPGQPLRNGIEIDRRSLNAEFTTAHISEHGGGIARLTSARAAQRHGFGDQVHRGDARFGSPQTHLDDAAIGPHRLYGAGGRFSETGEVDNQIQLQRCKLAHIRHNVTHTLIPRGGPCLAARFGAVNLRPIQNRNPCACHAETTKTHDPDTLPRTKLSREHHRMVRGLAGVGRGRALHEAYVAGKSDETMFRQNAMSRITTVALPSRAIGLRSRCDDAVPHAKPGNALSRFGNNAGDLMAEDNGRFLRHERRQRTVHSADIAMAKARAAHLHDHFARARSRILPLDQQKRLMRAREQPTLHNRQSPPQGCYPS